MKQLIVLLFMIVSLPFAAQAQGTIDNRAQWSPNLNVLDIVSGGRKFSGYELAKTYNGYALYRHEISGSSSMGYIAFMDDEMQPYIMALPKRDAPFTVEPINIKELKRIAAQHPDEHFRILWRRLEQADAGFALMRAVTPSHGLEEIVSYAESGRMEPLHQFHDTYTGYFDETDDFDFIRIASIERPVRTAADALNAALSENHEETIIPDEAPPVHTEYRDFVSSELVVSEILEKCDAAVLNKELSIKKKFAITDAFGAEFTRMTPEYPPVDKSDRLRGDQCLYVQHPMALLKVAIHFSELSRSFVDENLPKINSEQWELHYPYRSDLSELSFRLQIAASHARSANQIFEYLIETQSHIDRDELETPIEFNERVFDVIGALHEMMKPRSATYRLKRTEHAAAVCGTENIENYRELRELFWRPAFEQIGCAKILTDFLTR